MERRPSTRDRDRELDHCLRTAAPARNVPATVALVVIAVAAVSGVPFLARIEPSVGAAVADQITRPVWEGTHDASWSVAAAEPPDRAFMSASRHDVAGDAAAWAGIPQPGWIAEHLFVVSVGTPATHDPILAWSPSAPMTVALGCVRVVKAIPSGEPADDLDATTTILGASPVFLAGFLIEVTRLDFDVNGVLVTSAQVDCSTL